MGNPYDHFLLETATAIGSVDGAANFQWGASAMKTRGVIDLVGIKTRNTGSGTVEIHIVDGASGYNAFQIHTATPIPVQEGANYAYWAAGDYFTDGPCVIGVKTANTASGKVEVHTLSAASSYQNLSVYPTPIDAPDGAANYKWAYQSGGAELALPALFAIKVQSTGRDSMVVRILDGSLQFQSFAAEVGTEIALSDAANYKWAVAGIFNGLTYLPDLFAIKVTNTHSGKVEVNRLTGQSFYNTSSLNALTPIDAADGASNYHWAMDWFNADQSPDLIGIKTTNTGSGSVELHVLSGTASEPASCAGLRAKIAKLNDQIAFQEDLLTGDPRHDARIRTAIARLQASLNGVNAQMAALGCTK